MPIAKFGEPIREWEVMRPICQEWVHKARAIRRDPKCESDAVFESRTQDAKNKAIDDLVGEKDEDGNYITTDEEYKNLTIDECNRILDKFKRAILVLNNGLQKNRFPDLAEDKMEQNEDLAKLRAGVSLAKSGAPSTVVKIDD